MKVNSMSDRTSAKDLPAPAKKTPLYVLVLLFFFSFLLNFVGFVLGILIVGVKAKERKSKVIALFAGLIMSWIAWYAVTNVFSKQIEEYLFTSFFPDRQEILIIQKELAQKHPDSEFGVTFNISTRNGIETQSITITVLTDGTPNQEKARDIAGQTCAILDRLEKPYDTVGISMEGAIGIGPLSANTSFDQSASCSDWLQL